LLAETVVRSPKEKRWTRITWAWSSSAAPTILYVEHGSEFAAEAASAATLAIVPLALFALISAHLSRRHGWLLTLMIGWVVVLLAALALAQVRLPAVIALLLALLALHLA
jgi:MFS family permease